MENMRPWSFARVRTGAIIFLFGVLCCGVARAQVEGKGAEPAWSKGPADARVVLEIFNDYQCPPCGAFNPELNRVLYAFPRDVRVIYRNLPLRIHKFALPAARAAEAAGLQGRFLQMKELLLARQAEWAVSADPDRLFRRYARWLKLDRTKFRRDLASPGVPDRIEADKRRGDALDMNGTPTLFMNGKIITFEDTNFDRLSVMIREELKRE